MNRDASAVNPSGVFRELSRLCAGDHSIYLRNDPQSFLELHRDGRQGVFTSAVAALMPSVVIKMQMPFVRSIISALPSQQGYQVLHTKTQLYVVDSVTDIVGLVRHHKAAFIRDDATVAVWSQDLPLALASLHRVIKDVFLGKYDVARAVDPTPFQGDYALDGSSAMDYFDEYIHNYAPPTPVINKSEDVTSTVFQVTRNALPPLGLNDVSTLDTHHLFGRTHFLDSISPSSSDSPMLGDSPAGLASCTMSAGFSRLRLSSSLPSSPSSSRSPASLSSTFSSPSTSSDRAFDSVFSTPLTVSPSALSSSNSWNCIPLPDSPVPSIIVESPTDEASQTTPAEPTRELPAVLPLPVPEPVPEVEVVVQSPGKRKRTSKAKEPSSKAGTLQVPARRSTRAVALATKQPIAPSSGVRRASKPSPKSASPPQIKAPKAMRTNVPPRALCFLPGRVTRSTRSSSSSTTTTGSANVTAKAVSSKAAAAARLTSKQVTYAACCNEEHGHAHELLWDEDDSSEYEADTSEQDDDYRPYKRTRSATATTLTSSRALSTTLASPAKRKAISPKIAKSKGTSGKKSSSSSSKQSKKNPNKNTPKEPVPRPQCIWCDEFFSRESDVLRHERKSCKLYPFDQKRDYCDICGLEISRNDAVLRHLGSQRCKNQQLLNAAEEAALADEFNADEE